MRFIVYYTAKITKRSEISAKNFLDCTEGMFKSSWCIYRESCTGTHFEGWDFCRGNGHLEIGSRNKTNHRNNINIQYISMIGNRFFKEFYGF